LNNSNSHKKLLFLKRNGQPATVGRARESSSRPLVWPNLLQNIYKTFANFKQFCLAPRKNVSALIIAH
jgi:hypothetical protein